MLKINQKLIPESNIGKVITLNNEWRTAFKAYGASLTTSIPINNSSKASLTVNLTGEIYSGGWSAITVATTAFTETEAILTFNTTASLTNGNCYLIRLKGTITAQ